MSSATFAFGETRTVTFASTAAFKAAAKGALTRDGFLRLIGHTVDPSNGAFASFASDEQSFLARRPWLVVVYTAATAVASAPEIRLDLLSDDDPAFEALDSTDDN